MVPEITLLVRTGLLRMILVLLKALRSPMAPLAAQPRVGRLGKKRAEAIFSLIMARRTKPMPQMTRKRPRAIP